MCLPCAMGTGVSVCVSVLPSGAHCSRGGGVGARVRVRVFMVELAGDEFSAFLLLLPL